MYYLFLFLSLFFTKTQPVIIIQVGEIKQSIIHDVSIKINKIYHVNTVILREDGILNSSYIPEWNVYNTNNVVSDISHFYPNERVIIITDKALICITNYDIFRNLFNVMPVYGYTHYWKPVCIISTYGLNRHHIHSEMNILAIHELGHTYGLNHCGDPYCYMTQGDGTTGGIDKGYHFCNICLKQLNGK